MMTRKESKLDLETEIREKLLVFLYLKLQLFIEFFGL